VRSAVPCARVNRGGTAPETRDVDDQVQWLDDATVLYALAGEDGRSSEQWAVPADGGGAPRLVLRGAYSAAVHREASR
jgi:hypothetical protein